MKNLLIIFILVFTACSNYKQLDVYVILTELIKSSEELKIFFEKENQKFENFKLSVDLPRTVLYYHDIKNLMNKDCLSKIMPLNHYQEKDIISYSYHLDSILNTVREYKYFTTPIELIEEESKYLIRYSNTYENIVFASVSNWYSPDREKRLLHFIFFLDNSGKVICRNSIVTIEEEVDPY